MKKLSLAFLLIAMLCSFMIPVMAEEASPVKDYDAAANGELLYTIDFSGKDGVMEFTAKTTAENPMFTYTPSEDGKAVTVTGAPGATGSAGSHWYGMIPSLYANDTTVYSMVYKVKTNGATGTDNSIGVGGLFLHKSTSGYLNFYSNHNTPGESSRRGVLQQGSAKIADREYTMFKLLNSKYDVDDQNFMTVMTVFNGKKGTFAAYLLKDGATDYTKEDSWILVDSIGYVGGDDDCMGFGLYSYRPLKVNATVRDVSIYKGMLFKDPFVTEPEPTEAPTEAPTTPAKPTVGAPTVDNTPSTETPAQNNSPMVGIIIGVVAGVAVIAAIVIVVLKKKK